MKKRSIIELTPLLDVILLLIFAFLINMQGESDSMNEKYEKLEQKYEAAADDAERLREENEALRAQISALESQNLELKGEADDLTRRIGYEAMANADEKKTLEQALEAVSDITGMEGGRLKELLDGTPGAKDALDGILDADDAVLQMFKYDYVMNRFFFIDLELTGAENRVVINSEETQIAIGAADDADADARRAKSLKIYDELQKLIDARPGGDEMVMVTLIVRDPEVYQYAYEIAWESLRELELRASGYRLYKTGYTYTD